MEKKRMGRPPKAPDERAGPAIQFRVRGDLKAELDRHALLSGRSLSEECEFRLHRSVQREAALAEMFGASDQQSFLLAIGNVVRLSHAMSDGREDATLQAYAAVISLVEGLSGKKARDLIAEAALAGNSGEQAAERVLLLRTGDLQPQKSISEILGR